MGGYVQWLPRVLVANNNLRIRNIPFECSGENYRSQTNRPRIIEASMSETHTSDVNGDFLYIIYGTYVTPYIQVIHLLTILNSATVQFFKQTITRSRSPQNVLRSPSITALPVGQLSDP